MPSSGRRRELLVDTSVAIALVVGDHEHHDATFEALADSRLGLAGHAAFEAYSVLTRLPAPSRRTPRAAGRLLASNFPQTRFLSPEASSKLLEELAATGITGGSAYDALVGAVALEYGLTLATRDRRALETYRLLDVSVEMLA